MSKFAFIGAGNMGGALAEAVCRAKTPESVIIYDLNTDKLKSLSEKSGCLAALTAEEAVSAAKFVFLCVKPKVLPAVLKELLPCFDRCIKNGESKVLVSIAAGIKIETIENILSDGGISLPIIRLMPNTPVMIGKGMVLVMPSKEATESDTSELIDALSASGKVELFDETLVDAATPVFSCSPAYAYMFIEALADGGVMSGIPRDKAQRFAAQALLGASSMVLETRKHPGELKDEVCSPGGSTIVGVEQLEKGGFRAAVASAVYEAYIKTIELGK